MFPLKRKALLKRLNVEKPRITVSEYDEQETKDSNEEKQGQLKIEEGKLSNQSQISAKNLLKVPEEYSDTSDDEEEEDEGIAKTSNVDDILNNLRLMKLKTQELAHDFQQLTLKTNNMWDDLNEIRILKK